MTMSVKELSFSLPPPGESGYIERSSSSGRAGPLGPPNSKSSFLPRRQTLSHSVPPWARINAIFFLTICCRARGVNQLCQPAVASVLWDAVGFRQLAGRWFVHLALLMPDHLHALASFPREEDMRAVVGNFKEVTAKRAGVVWQRDFSDHRLRGGESWREKWDYIAMKPVRKGLIGDPAQWPYVWRADAMSGGPSGANCDRLRGPALPTGGLQTGGPSGPALPE